MAIVSELTFRRGVNGGLVLYIGGWRGRVSQGWRPPLSGVITIVTEWGMVLAGELSNGCDGMEMSALEEYVDELLASGADSVCVGPTVKRAAGDGRAPPWYFVVASGGPSFTDTFFCHLMGGEDRTLVGELRMSFYAKLRSQPRPLVVHLFDDELDMARWCSRIWPGEEPLAILRAIEAERQGSVH